MAPLIALGISLLPSLARLLVGERAGQIAATVTEAVREITGTDDPAVAHGRLDADPAAASQLRIRLAEIALEGERLRAETEEHERQVTLETLRTGLQDLQNARGTMTSLAGIGSALSWGPALVSAIVTTGFFGMLGLFLVWTPSAGDQQAYALLNIAVGALVAGFTAVINFWMGSSQSSRDKDETLRRLSDAQGDTFGRAQAAMAETMDRAHAVVADTTERARSAVAETTERAQAAMAAMVAGGEPVELGGDGFGFAALRRPAQARAGAQFLRCLQTVLGQEGGYVNDARDPGGATMMGITQATLAAWRGRPVSIEEVRALTEEEAREIYRANYWNVLRCEDLPRGLDLMAFDFGVNAGPGTAARLLQRALAVKDDGAIGPITLAAARAIDLRGGIDRMARLREEYYRGLANFDRFGRGWLNRTDTVRRAAQEMAAGVAPAAAAVRS